MKKIFTILLVVIFTLSISSSVFAVQPNNTNSNKLHLNAKEKERLSSFGFTKEEIRDFTVAEYETFLERFKSKENGQVVETHTSYFRMNPGSVEKISEDQALKEVKAHKEKLNDNKQGDISILGETAYTSWIKLTQSKIKFWNSSAGRYEYGLKLSYQWLSEPTWKLTDVVGITKSSYMNVVNDTDYAYYNYDYWDGRITHTVNDYSSGAEHGTIYGLAFDVDLKGVSPDGNYPSTNHRGYMYYEVAPASSQYTTMEVRGHYAHLAWTLDFGVSLTSGDMSITGTNEVDYANDTFYTYSL